MFIHGFWSKFLDLDLLTPTNLPIPFPYIFSSVTVYNLFNSNMGGSSSPVSIHKPFISANRKMDRTDWQSEYYVLPKGFSHAKL